MPSISLFSNTLMQNSQDKESSVNDSLKIQRKAAEIYYQDRFGLIKQQCKATINAPSPKNKIVVAYLSADFRSHPISFLIVQI